MQDPRVEAIGACGTGFNPLDYGQGARDMRTQSDEILASTAGYHCDNAVTPRPPARVAHERSVNRPAHRPAADHLLRT
ncbi:hypothetical protein TVNIR_2338 [Thioalkalivibrio nitratireducens DSM 14787]|uniref:Uncharacterized protein n=1 Tax=Thioalkalivibrio nitratireducens (strain DSM 14787 / UNIQEM 213 / ALEN2) TaxID=1255043 RepID=L0E036_THIND|nr:hypothetical protein TVNIR_2338 [Thioalkalivibrio nitratireducens DSM 14787]